MATRRPTAVPRALRGGLPPARLVAVILYSLLLAGAGVLLWVLDVRQLAPIRTPHMLGPGWFDFGLLVVSFAVARLLVVRIYHGSHVLYTGLGEVPLVAALIFAPPRLVPFAALGGTLIWGLARRMPAVKLTYNAGVFFLSGVGAEVIYRLLLGTHRPLGLLGAASALVAVLAVDVLGASSGRIVVRLASGSAPPYTQLSDYLVLRGAELAAIALGLVDAYVLWVEPLSIIFVGLLIVVFFLMFRSEGRLRAKYANLESLYGFMRRLAGQVDQDALIESALGDAARLLRAERATLFLRLGPRRLGVVEVHPGGPVTRDVRPLEEEGWLRPVLEDGRSLSLPRNTRERDGRVALLRHRARDLLAVPLVASEEVGEVIEGALVVADRQDRESTFDRADLAVFRALADHTAIALRSARLLEALQRESLEREFRALHDPLTGLPNRYLFLQEVGSITSVDPGRAVAVLLLDLDRFREVNDTLGHANGDLLLQEVANRLTRAVADQGVVARLGGDEFAACLPAVAQSGTELAERLLRGLSAPFELEDLPLEMGASIGIALFPFHGEDPALLLRRAEMAMYSAKSEQRRIAMFAPEHDRYSPRRLALAAELRAALDSRALLLHYQPLVNLASGRPVGAEALVRWDHPRHGLLPPDEFVPIAEQTGLIGPLTRWVLEEAISTVAAWRQEGLKLTVAVNLSVRNLSERDLPQLVSDLLTRYGLPASALTLELTESSMMSDLTRTILLLNALSHLGVKIAVDDFGTGYSSLSYLSRLPVDAVKIDKSFVQHMTVDAGDAIIVRSTIDLARNLGLKVVAEGVETRITAERLRAMGADLGQGYLLSRPLKAEEFRIWARARLERVANPSPEVDAAPPPALRLLPGRDADAG